MKKFIGQVLLFLSPLLIVPIVYAYIYYSAAKTGEFAAVDVNIERQREDGGILFGMGYNEQTDYYKLKNLTYYKPELFALGTSRVMQFKDEFFDGSFYNCGGAVGQNYSEYRNFIRNVDYDPKMVIIGIDYWVFNDNWNNWCRDYDEFEEIESMDADIPALMKTIVSDRLHNKWTGETINNYPDNLGFNGRVKDAGYMNDGSYYYGNLYRNPESSDDCQFAETLDRIGHGGVRFEWADHIDDDTLRQLKDLLSYCRERDIYVIGFLAPLPPAIYDVMVKSGDYGYLDEVAPACGEIFGEYNYEFYDYLDGEKLGMGDEYYIDGSHGSELVYGRIIEDMAEHGSKVKRYADLNTIRKLLSDPYSKVVFENPDMRNF